MKLKIFKVYIKLLFKYTIFTLLNQDSILKSIFAINHKVLLCNNKEHFDYYIVFERIIENKS